jgi:glycosyltransferase involved in cell wall biosynthesis
MKISIITTSYNSAATLRDTMDSVLRQGYTDYEYIVVDGASKDGTVEIIREYEPRFEGRMRWVSEPDGGIYDAMNKGVAMATGDVVGLLNSDDFYATDDILSVIAEEFSRSDALDAIFGDVHYVDENDITKVVRYYSSQQFARERMLAGYIPAHPSFYVRRECYEKYGAFDTSYRVAADFENLLRLIYINKISIRYVPKDFVAMRMGGASSSGLSSYRRIISDHFRAYRKNDITPRYLLYFWRYVKKLFEFSRKNRAKVAVDN